MTDLPTGPYAGHYETAGLDEAWREGFKAGRVEWEATIDIDDLLADLHDAVIYGSYGTGCDFDSVIAREVLAVHGIKNAAVKEDTP